MQQAWSRKHPTAHEQLPIDLISNELVTRNTKWLDVFVGDFFMGSWLNGRIFKKCRKMWLVVVKNDSRCIETIETTKEEAESVLLDANSQPPHGASINRWQIHVDEDDIKCSTHSIKIMLSDDRYFLVSDDDDVLSALSKYKWRDENNDLYPGDNSYRAVNEDKDNNCDWKNAQDLVLFTMLRKVTKSESTVASTEDEISIETISDYSDFVVINTTGASTHDYRTDKIGFHLERKAAKSQQDENTETYTEMDTSQNKERKIQLSHKRNEIVKRWTDHRARMHMDIKTMLNKINREYAEFLKGNVHNASNASAAAAAAPSPMLD